jgi:small subunit ribosomal protein S19
MSSKKIFYYRGRTLEELQKLSMDELIELLPARARRSLARARSQEHIKLFGKLNKVENPKKLIRTHLRDFIILPNMVGRTLNVHSGKEFVSVKIIPECIGHYLGEYSQTKKIVKHSSPGVGATRSSQFVPLK